MKKLTVFTVLIVFLYVSLEGIYFFNNKGTNKHSENDIKKCINLDKEAIKISKSEFIKRVVN